VREKDERENRRGDTSDRGLRDGIGGKDRGSRETTLERGGGGRVGQEDVASRRDDGVSSRDISRKRESQMLPGIVEKTTQDREFVSKSMWIRTHWRLLLYRWISSIKPQLFCMTTVSVSLTTCPLKCKLPYFPAYKTLFSPKKFELRLVHRG
jgi:hypothetical protein